MAPDARCDEPTGLRTFEENWTIVRQAYRDNAPGDVPPAAYHVAEHLDKIRVEQRGVIEVLQASEVWLSRALDDERAVVRELRSQLVKVRDDLTALIGGEL